MIDEAEKFDSDKMARFTEFECKIKELEKFKLNSAENEMRILK